MFSILIAASKNKDLLLVGALIVLIFASLFIHSGQGPMVGNRDIATFYVINQDMQCPTLNSLAAAASRIGSVDIYIMTLSIFAIMIVSMIRHNKELRNLAIVLLIAILVSVLIVHLLKTNFGVSRPYFYLGNVHVYCGGEWHSIEYPLSEGDKRNSFPSGHATRAFVILGVLWIYKRLRMLFFIFILMELFLLVYTGSHYASDVIMGSIVGFTIGYLIQKNLMQRDLMKPILRYI